MIHNKRRLVYEKRVVHRIFGLQGKEVRERKRKIQIGALCNVYSLPNKVIK
jgi:hypothetical protein